MRLLWFGMSRNSFIRCYLAIAVSYEFWIEFFVSLFYEHVCECSLMLSQKLWTWSSRGIWDTQTTFKRFDVFESIFQKSLWSAIIIILIMSGHRGHSNRSGWGFGFEYFAKFRLSSVIKHATHFQVVYVLYWILKYITFSVAGFIWLKVWMNTFKIKNLVPYNVMYYPILLCS